MPNPPPPIVELHDVTAFRGRTRVFDGLSLEIAAGESTAILGPNGAGKSTLLKLLSRKLYPVRREGSHLRLFGRERWNIWELRTRLGMVSHDLQVEYPDRVTGLDVVLSGFFSSQGIWKNHDVGEVEREAARAAVERLGVAELADRPYAAMSTGQQRRFLLARALVHDPEVLVLDEPTSGLDLRACFDYLERIRALMRGDAAEVGVEVGAEEDASAMRGTTVVLATHHIHEIPPEMERVVLLAGGRVVADGPKEEVLTGSQLSETFGTTVDVVRANGFYQAVPGGRPESP